VVADAALLAGWEDVVFYDDAWPGRQDNRHWPVAGDLAAMLAQAAEFDAALVSIGNGQARWEKQCVLVAAGVRLATVVHPHAQVSRFATLGAGTVVMAGAVINADASVGDACIINTGATVDHDCALEHGVHISPGANLSGNVQIGALSWIGVGAAVRQGIAIGAGVMVGAGAVVVKPVTDGATMIGNPAREQIK
jgi:sugar O-acyltransferase (sialic acid O-acetyltransferase NeuD family)